METNITKPANLPIVNDQNCNGFFNRLTVFNDGEVRIEELAAHNANSISEMEFKGDAISCRLPGTVFDVDVEAIDEWIKSSSFEEVKDFLSDQPIESAIDFFGDYIHGWYEDCATDEEMNELIEKHGRDVDAIADAIRECGESFVALDDWVETWLDNNPVENVIKI